MPTRDKLKFSESQQYTFICISGGLFIAAGIWFSFRGLDGFKIFADRTILLSVVVAVIALFGTGYLISIYMHHLINQKGVSAVLVGILGSLVILSIGTIAGSSVYAFEYSYPTNSIGKVILDYYYTPLIIILIIGGIPTLILGAILGKKIKE